MRPVRVLVAAASAVTRAGLEALLGGSDAVAVVASAPDVAAAGARVGELDPDVILLAIDARKPPADAGRLAGAQETNGRPPAVVVMLDVADAQATATALRAGARGVLPHDASGEEIVAALVAAAAGLVVLHADAMHPAAVAAARAAPEPGPNGLPPPLTPREIEVLGMLAEGLANKAIAPRLGISEHTVKAHVAAIFAKLHATTRAEAVAIGVRQGLIML